MHKIEIPQFHEIHFLPSEMSELTISQYDRLCRVLCTLKEHPDDPDNVLLQVLSALIDLEVTAKYFRLSENARENIAENINQMIPLVKSIFEERTTDAGEIILLPSIAFVDNKIPKIGNLTGPADALQNCTFFEYKEAYSAWYQFQQTQDPIHLDTMIAILYRPEKSFLFFRKRLKHYNGDPRQAYNVLSNPLELQKRLLFVSKISGHIKYGVWLWFTACMEFLRTGKPTIDGNQIDLSILYDGDGAGSAGIGLTGIIYSLAETGVFGNIRETGDSNLYDVLARLYQVKLQMDELKKSQK